MQNFNRVSNPYIAGGVITTSKGFYGREDILEYLSFVFNEGRRAIILCGGRRAGKTSLCFQIQNGRLGDRFLPVRISFEDVALTEHVADAFQNFMEMIAARFTKHGIQFDLRFYSPEDLRNDPYGIFKKFIEQALEKRAGKKILLMLDEYDIAYRQRAARKWDKRIIQFWEHLVKSYPEIHFILVGTQTFYLNPPESIKRLLDSEGEKKELDVLSENEAKRLIQEPAENILEYDDEIIHQILRLSGRHPFFTQVICQRIFDICKKQQQHNVTPAELKQAVSNFNNNPHNHMVKIWDDFHIGDDITDETADEADKSLSLNQKIVAVLCHTLKDGNAFLSSDDLQKALQAREVYVRRTKIDRVVEELVNRKFLESKENTFRFTIDLIRKWIKHNYSFIASESEFQLRWRRAIFAASLGILASLILFIFFNPEINYNSGKKAIEEGKLSDGVRKYKRAIKAFRYFPEFLVDISKEDLNNELGWVYLDNDSLDNALGLVEDGSLSDEKLEEKIYLRVADNAIAKQTPQDSLDALKYYAAVAADSAGFMEEIILLRRALLKNNHLPDPRIENFIQEDSLVTFQQGINHGIFKDMKGRIYRFFTPGKRDYIGEFQVTEARDSSAMAKIIIMHKKLETTDLLEIPIYR
ncbi:MAG: hypothetical protein ACE5I1_14815 [bacterium]